MSQPRMTSNLQRLLSSAKLVKSLVVSEEPHLQASLSVPGIGAGCFDRQGNPSPVSVMNLVGFSRIYALNMPLDDTGRSFLDWSDLTRDRMTFISSTRLKFGRQVYDMAVSKAIFDCKTSLGYLGNSSVALVTDVSLPDNPELIFQQMNQSVCIDRALRRPTPLPDWFKEKYRGKGTLEKGVIVKPLEKPAHTFVYDLKVAWSDTDFYNHTNYASYVRFGIDAIHAALRQSKMDAGDDQEEATSNPQPSALKGLSEMVVGRGTKAVDICYLKESLENQRLDVHVWQDQGGSPLVVKCAIEHQGQDICHLTFEYFDSE